MALTAIASCEEQGWFDLMEARGEVLAVLEPGEGGWKSAADELSYINAAMSFIESGKNAKWCGSLHELQHSSTSLVMMQRRSSAGILGS